MISLYKENIDEVGDLYLDVAEAYMTCQVYSKAKVLLDKLVSSVNYNMVRIHTLRLKGVWCNLYQTLDLESMDISKQEKCSQLF